MFRQFLAVTAAFAAVPASAAVYSATPVTTPADAQIVARDIAWACDGQSCTGSTSNGRPLVICQAFAKKAGRIASFNVDGRALAAAELDRCNTSAKPDRNSAVATVR